MHYLYFLVACLTFVLLNRWGIHFGGEFPIETLAGAILWPAVLPAAVLHKIDSAPTREERIEEELKEADRLLKKAEEDL